MRYYRVTDKNNNSCFEGFLHKENKNFIYLIPILDYLWASEINLDLNNDLIQKNKYIIEDFFIEELNDFTFDNYWVLDYTIEEKNIIFFKEICNFFSDFINFEGDYFTKLNFCFSLYNDSLNNHEILKIFNFLISKFNIKINNDSKIKKFIDDNKFIKGFYKFDNSINGNNQTGFFFDKDDKYYYYYDSYLFLNLSLNNKEIIIDLPYHKIDRNNFNFEMIETPNFDWSHNFMIKKEDLVYANGISYFFDTFFNYSDFPFIKRLEICSRHKRYFISNDLMCRLIEFIGDNFRNERINILFSKELNKYKK